MAALYSVHHTLRPSQTVFAAFFSIVVITRVSYRYEEFRVAYSQRRLPSPYPFSPGRSVLYAVYISTNAFGLSCLLCNRLGYTSSTRHFVQRPSLKQIPHFDFAALFAVILLEDQRCRLAMHCRVSPKFSRQSAMSTTIPSGGFYVPAAPVCFGAHVRRL